MKRFTVPTRWQRLETHMIIQAALAALLPMIALAALSLYTVYTQQVSDANAIQQEMTKRAELLIETRLNHIVYALQVASETSNWNLQAPEEHAHNLRRLLHQLPLVQEISLVDMAGQETFGVSKMRLMTLDDLRDVSHVAAFEDAQTGAIGWQDVYLSPNGEPLLKVFVPKLAPLTRKPEGYIEAVVSLRGLWDEVMAFKVGRGGVMYVVDANGRLLAHPDYSLVLADTNIGSSFLFQTLQNGQPLPNAYRSAWDKPVMGSAGAIPDLGWWVVVEQVTAEALAPVRTLFYFLLVGVLLAMAASAIPGWFIARSVTHPITTLSADAVAVGQGALSLRSNIQREDEIGQLASAFNHMVAELQVYATELENRVALRTEELQIALERAMEADRVKSEFLATVSHELRTPLTSIKGFAETLLSEDVTWDQATQRDFLSTIVEESDRLRDLVNQLLDMAQLEAGSLHLQRHRCDLLHIIAVTLERLHPLLKSHAVRVAIPTDLPPIYADRERVIDILRNLLENVVKYTPPGTSITLTGQVVGDEVQIDLNDNGPGIPEDVLPHLFERFHRGDHPDIPGTGLGLAICRGLVQAHGGRIWAESRVGEETTVHFTLPIST